MGRFLSFPLGVALLAIGCHSAPSPNAPSEKSPATTAPEAPRSFEEPRETGKFPPVCGARSAYCDALAEARSKKQAEARESLARLIRSEPSRPEAYVELARSWTETESFAFGTGGAGARRALGILMEAEERARSPMVRLELAQVQLALGDGVSAEERLLSLRREYPMEPEVHGALGVAFLAQGKVERALEPLGRASVLDPANAERKLTLGSARMLFGDFVGAESAFREALQLAPNSFKAHSDLGSTLLLTGRVAEGASELRRALELEPRRATVLSNLAYAELLLGEPKKALEFATRATEVDPSLGSAWLNLGLARAALKDFSFARAAFEKALELDPTDPRVLENLKELDAAEKN